MVKRTVIAGVLLCIGVGVSQAAISEVSGSSSKTNWRIPSGSAWDVFASPSILGTQVGIGLGIRHALRGLWSWEAGGVLPHQVAGYGHDSSFTPGTPQNESTTARVRSYAEMHAVALYTFIEKKKLAVDGGLGLSLGVFNNRADIIHTSSTPGGVTFASHPNSHAFVPAPRLQLGIRYPITSRFAVRLTAAYMYYVNHESINNHTYNLSFGGIAVEPGVVWVF